MAANDREHGFGVSFKQIGDEVIGMLRRDGVRSCQDRRIGNLSNAVSDVNTSRFRQGSSGGTHARWRWDGHYRIDLHVAN